MRYRESRVRERRERRREETGKETDRQSDTQTRESSTIHHLVYMYDVLGPRVAHIHPPPPVSAGAHSCPPEGSFQCKTGHCILSSFKCDGDRDCDDVSDEEGCPSRYPGGRYCRTDEFTCKNTVRINVYVEWTV